MTLQFFQLERLGRFSDISVLALRAFTGIFLIWGVWDNISDQARLAEFVAFLSNFGFPAPAVMAQLTVWAQFICGGLLVIGLFTRLAGAVMVFNFVVAYLMVHTGDDFRAQFPALILVFVSLYFATAGGGRFALDNLIVKGTQAS